MSQQRTDDPFTNHSDVTLAYPDLFEDLDETLAHSVRTTMAESILEGRSPSREAVERRIRLLAETRG